MYTVYTDKIDLEEKVFFHTVFFKRFTLHAFIAPLQIPTRERHRKAAV
jgi:hypothetical protein